MDDSANILPAVVEHVPTNYHNENTHTDYIENSTPPNRDRQNHLKRNLICFWLIGLCGSIGFTTLSSSAFDIIKKLEGISVNNNYTDGNVSNHTRDCIADLPAVSILADKIPSFLLKLVLPFIPFYAKTNIVLSCVLAIASYIIVAMAQHKWQAIVGITLMSINGDLGDITILTYLAKFEDRKNIIVSYSSGGGAAGVIASSFYATLSDIGFTPETILCMLIVVPLMGLGAFLLIKESNVSSSPRLLDDGIDENDSNTTETPPATSLLEKWRYLPKLTIFFIPMLLNCSFEYIISQTFDLLYVPDIWLSHADQYRWISAICNFGSLFGRLALSYIVIDGIWSLNLLTGTFMAYFLFESIYMTIPSISVIFIFVFLVEFISDYTMFSVYNKLSTETPLNYQVFAVCCVSIGLSIGVILSGAIAIPLHSAICKLPPPI